MKYKSKDQAAMVDEFINKARNGGGDVAAQSPEDQFINNANDEDRKSVIPEADEDDARFLQNSINMYNNILADKSGQVPATPLKIDGIIGPKSKQAVKQAYSTLTPEMRKMVATKMNGKG